MYITSLLLTISCLVNQAHAREPIDVNLDVVTAQGASKQEAFDKATEEATLKAGEDLVGPEKLGPVWPQIKSKLLKKSARYVLFIRAAGSNDTPEGTKTSVQMRLSSDGLEGLLREFGLFNGASVRVLPLISVQEAHGSRYAWWAETFDQKGGGLAQDYFKRVIAQLNAAAKGKSIYIMDVLTPALRAGIPSSYRVETLRHDDQLLLARYLKADVVMTGRVEVAKGASGPQLSIGLELWQARNGRVITESSKVENLPTDVPKIVGQAIDQASKRVLGDVTAKLMDVAGGGALNLNTVRLGIAGTLNFRQQAELRKQLGEQREIRAMRDRLFEPNKVTYEIDSPLAGPDLGRALAHVPFKGFAISLGETGADAVVLNVRPVSTGG